MKKVISTQGISFDDLVEYTTDKPDEVPHLAVIGPSGSGKTTLVVTLLGMRPGQIAALSGKEEDRWTKWRGLEVAGLDDDLSYQPCVELFDELLIEVKRRNLAVRRGKATFPWLTVVIDDLGVLRKECPSAVEVVKVISRVGRSLKVRLIILSGSGQVAELGLEGEGETRSHFAFIKLERGRTGTIEIEDDIDRVDLGEILRDHEETDLRGRTWRPSKKDDGILISLIMIAIALVFFVGGTLAWGSPIGMLLALAAWLIMKGASRG